MSAVSETGYALFRYPPEPIQDAQDRIDREMPLVGESHELTSVKRAFERAQAQQQRWGFVVFPEPYKIKRFRRSPNGGYGVAIDRKGSGYSRHWPTLKLAKNFTARQNEMERVGTMLFLQSRGKR